MATVSRSAQMRSPNTPLEAQLRVDRGGLNRSGLTIIQTSATATAIRQYQPIHSRLQIASASSETTEKRVQTLHGFAWRIQASPSRPKSLASRRSVVAALGGAAGGDVVEVMPSTLPPGRPAVIRGAP